MSVTCSRRVISSRGDHFRALWEGIAGDSRADGRKLIEAARMEIWEHITFWDDVYSSFLPAGRQLVLDPVMAGNN